MPDGIIGADRFKWTPACFDDAENDPATLTCNAARDTAGEITDLLDRYPGDIPVTVAELERLVAPLDAVRDTLRRRLGQPRVLVNGWLVPATVAEAIRRQQLADGGAAERARQAALLRLPAHSDHLHGDGCVA